MFLFFQNFKKMRKYGLWPKKRSSHAACVLNYDQEFPQLLMTGGLDENIQALGDLWLLSVDLGIWIKAYFFCVSYIGLVHCAIMF